MKRFMLLAIMLISLIMVSQAQEECTDVIYSVDNTVILDCCIDKIVNNNVVIYTKGGKELMAQAVAVKRNGQYVTLANDGVIDKMDSPVMQVVTPSGNSKYALSYEHYQNQYRIGRQLKTFGTIIIWGGLGLAGAGVYFFTKDNLASNQSKAHTLFNVSLITISIGVPLFAIGKSLKVNNLKAMESFNKDTAMSLSAGITGNGVGLVLNF